MYPNATPHTRGGRLCAPRSRFAFSSRRRSKAVVPGLKDVVQGSTCATSSRPRAVPAAASPAFLAIPGRNEASPSNPPDSRFILRRRWRIGSLVRVVLLGPLDLVDGAGNTRSPWRRPRVGAKVAWIAGGRSTGRAGSHLNLTFKGSRSATTAPRPGVLGSASVTTHDSK